MIVSVPDVPLFLLVCDIDWRRNNNTTPAILYTYTHGDKNAPEIKIRQNRAFQLCPEEKSSPR